VKSVADDLLAIAFAGLVVLVMGVCLWGWLANLIAVFSTETFAWLVLRLVGVVIPFIGVILGYL
jgi:hypothetical protein